VRERERERESTELERKRLIKIRKKQENKTWCRYFLSLTPDSVPPAMCFHLNGDTIGACAFMSNRGERKKVGTSEMEYGPI
jgi:hypothetical protein